MAKNTFSDIVPPERRSIRNIPLSGSRPRRAGRPSSRGEAPPPPPPPPPPPLERPEPPERPERPPRIREGRSRSISSVLFWVGGVVILGGVAFSLSFLFAGATVTVTPKQVTTPVDTTLTVRAGEGEAGAFQAMQVEAIGSETVASSGEEEVEVKASGQIVIYNNYSEEPQRLITNTRFETPEGLIYRIDKPVVVPGMTTQNGEPTAGSVTVTVYADDAGEEYNIGLTDFTIPGFRGSEQYEDMYARSKTPMTGGFIGVRPTISEEDLERARAAIEGRLRSELLGLAQSQKPAGFLLFPDATFITYENLPAEASGENVSARVRGVLHAIIFSERSFGMAVAANTIGGYDGNPVVIKNPEEISVRFPDEALETEPWTKSELEASISGRATIEWVFDSAAFKQDLAGKAKEAMPTILTGYPAISKADVVLRPFWKREFPENPEEIEVVVAPGGEGEESQ